MLRTVDSTIGFVKNVNSISRQVRNTRCHLLYRLEGKTMVEVYNEVQTAYSDKVRVRSSGVVSLKTTYVCA